MTPKYDLYNEVWLLLCFIMAWGSLVELLRISWCPFGVGGGFFGKKDGLFFLLYPSSHELPLLVCAVHIVESPAEDLSIGRDSDADVMTYAEALTASTRQGVGA